jgi:hypothetical protein
MCHLNPPAQEMEEIIGVTAQGGFRDATHSLLIQEAVDPFHLTAAVLRDAEGTAGVFQIATQDDVELHGNALSSSC